MNRREILASLIASGALARALPNAVALSDLRWDDASQLYGHAWDTLPTAPDGEIAILNLMRSVNSDAWEATQYLAVIHNNTGAEWVLSYLFTDDESQFPTFESTQNPIQAGGYALLTFSIDGVLPDDAPLPNLLPEFVSHEEALGTMGLYLDMVELRVDSAEFTESALGIAIDATVTNPSDMDLVDTMIVGTVMWFDADGLPVHSYSVGIEGDILAGESGSGATTLFTEFDPGWAFLVGYYGLPD